MALPGPKGGQRLDMNPVYPSGVDGANLFGETAKIGRKN